jgi:hypothetical protein
LRQQKAESKISHTITYVIKKGRKPFFYYIFKTRLLLKRKSERQDMLYILSFMNQLKHLLYVVTVFLLSISGANAQLFLEDLSLYPDQFVTKKIHDNPDINQYYPFIDGRGNYPNLSNQKEFPKKVALISFYIWNNEIVVTNKSANEFWRGSNWTASMDGNKLSSALISYSLESITKRFDSLGTKLISPGDFTAAQREAYDSLRINYVSSYRRKISDSVNYQSCSAISYKFIKLPNQKLDYIFANSLAELARVLEVDAVLLVQNDVTFAGTLGLINTITMNMYGFNPVSVSSDAVQGKKRSAKLNEFLLYSSIELDLEAIISQYDESGELKYENYIGYDRLLNLMIDQLYVSYLERTKITPKKS